MPLFCFADFFADVATFHTHNNNVNVTVHHILADFSETKHWIKRNKLPVNHKKTTCMSVGTRQRLNDSREIKLKSDDICTQNVSKQKLLGIYSDENLNGSLHIDYMCSNVSSKILLRKPSGNSKTVLIKFHNAFDRLWFCRLGLDVHSKS